MSKEKTGWGKLISLGKFFLASAGACLIIFNQNCSDDKVCKDQARLAIYACNFYESCYVDSQYIHQHYNHFFTLLGIKGNPAYSLQEIKSWPHNACMLTSLNVEPGKSYKLWTSMSPRLFDPAACCTFTVPVCLTKEIYLPPNCVFGCKDATSCDDNKDHCGNSPAQCQ